MVSGVTTLFQAGTRYGLKLALLLPALQACDRYALVADVRWGKDRVLSEEGRLFPAAGVDLPGSLPRLDGPDARIASVMALYGEARELFAATGTDVRALRLDRRGSWELELSGGIDVLVGSREARSRLDRFARLLPRLIAQRDASTRSAPLRRADLRYTNGFALTWGVPATP